MLQSAARNYFFIIFVKTRCIAPLTVGCVRDKKGQQKSCATYPQRFYSGASRERKTKEANPAWKMAVKTAVGRSRTLVSAKNTQIFLGFGIFNYNKYKVITRMIFVSSRSFCIFVIASASLGFCVQQRGIQTFWQIILQVNHQCDFHPC